MRRGQGISINMMIIVAIGLVVLVISILMYTQFVKKSDKTLSSCGLAGECIDVGFKSGEVLNECSVKGRGEGFGSCDTQAGMRCCQLATP